MKRQSNLRQRKILAGIIFAALGVLFAVRGSASVTDSMLAYIERNMKKGYILSYHPVTIDSVDLYLVVNFLVSEELTWESTTKAMGRVDQLVWDGGGFQVLKYMQRNPGDWIVCTLFLGEGDTVRLWNAEFAFYYGDSAVTALDYVSSESRWQFQLYVASDLITIPCEEITRGTQSNAPVLWLRFRKGTFEPKGEIWFGNRRFDPPDSIVVRNGWTR